MVSNDERPDPRDAGLSSGDLDLGFSDTPRPEGARVDSASETAFGQRVLNRLEQRQGSFSRYRVGEEIGRGGMGSVLEVWDEDLRRPLAMKVMRPEGFRQTAEESEHLLARFVEEAQVNGQLEHPGIVPVHELGLDAQGRVYFTMKRVQGRTLANIFELHRGGDKSWSEARVLNLLLRVCEAIAFAHDKGVVHRDLKPSNVMVGNFGEVYVLDWGLARLVNDDSGEEHPSPGAPATIHTDRRDHRIETPGSPLLTDEAAPLGTVPYASPEQAAGERGAVGPASDVYSLGAMLYELLTGRAPYLHENQRPNFQLVQAGPPTPIARLEPRAPQELVAICERAMARDLEERYPTMSELAVDLSAFQEGRVVAAYETGVWPEARKWILRNKGFAAAMAALFLALAAGLGASLYLRGQERERTEEVLAERDRLEKMVAYLGGLFGELDPYEFGLVIKSGARNQVTSRLRGKELPESEIAAGLARFDDGVALVNFTNAGVTALSQEILEPSLQEFTEEFKDDPVTLASLLLTIADSYNRLGLPEQALSPCRKSLELRRAELGDDHKDTIESMDGLASLLTQRGDYEEALSLQEEALERSRRIFGIESREALSCWGDLSGIWAATGELDRSLEVREKVVEASRRTLGLQDEHTIIAISNYANTLRSLQRFEKSLPIAEEALDLAREHLGPDHKNTLNMISNVGFDLNNLGRWDEALPYYEEAITERRRVFGDTHPDTLISVNNLASLFNSRGESSEAERLSREAIQSYREGLGETHPGYTMALNTMGLILWGRNAYVEALPFAQEAADLAPLVLPKRDRRVIRITRNLVAILEELKQYDKAFEHLERALNLSTEILGEDDPATIGTEADMSSLLLHVDDREGAVSFLNPALERWSAQLASKQSVTASDANLSYVIAGTLMELSRHAEALDLCEDSLRLAWKTWTTDHTYSTALKRVTDRCLSVLTSDDPEGIYAARAKKLQEEFDALKAKEDSEDQ